MRVYLPTTIEQLRQILASGRIPADVAYAVTPGLREWYLEGELEELEHIAMTRAARAALALLADRGDDAPRRVVLAAEVPDLPVTQLPEVDLAAVRLPDFPRLSNVVSAHVDDLAAAADVRRAVAAYPLALRGDADAQFAVDGVEDHELAWYAVQELEELLAQA